MDNQKNILAIIVSLFLFISACSSGDSDAANEQTAAQSETEQKKAPNFEVTTIEGETISLQQSMEENKPMVVYFTASWCPICAKNWPVLSKLYPEYKDRLNLVAISIDPTVWMGVSYITAYFVGISGMMIAVILLSTFAKDLLMKYLRKILPHMERITGGLLIVAGIYVIYYQTALL